MSALNAALLQVSATATIAGVCLAFLAYVTGADRFVVLAIRHPLQSFEIVALMALSILPAPRRKRPYKGRHVNAAVA